MHLMTWAVTWAADQALLNSPVLSSPVLLAPGSGRSACICVLEPQDATSCFCVPAGGNRAYTGMLLLHSIQKGAHQLGCDDRKVT